MYIFIILYHTLNEFSLNDTLKNFRFYLDMLYYLKLPRIFHSNGFYYYWTCLHDCNVAFHIPLTFPPNASPETPEYAESKEYSVIISLSGSVWFIHRKGS